MTEMMQSTLRVLSAVLLVVGLTGCAGNENVNVDATIQAGIAGTQSAEAQVENAVNQAVSATLTAMPTPTALAVEEISEEEFAQAVESSANDALDASDQASAATGSAAEDGEITEEELEELYYLYYWTLEEVEQALYLAEEYTDLYADLLDLTLSELDELEAELQAVLDATDEVIAALDEIFQILQQGGEITQQVLEDLQGLGEQISANAGIVRDHLPGWKSTRDQEISQLVDRALDVEPNDIADTRAGALAQARDYIQSMQSALGDGRFSLEELTAISQLGANASASFGRLGGDLGGLPDMINGLTSSFARGQLPEINLGLGSLQNSLPSIR